MKQKKFCIKNLIIKLMSCFMISFLVLTASVMPKKENYIVYADTYTPVQKQSFVTWLLSYFGINIYTDAQQISDDLYTVVKMAYDTYLATLQPQQQITFDDILDGVTWDNAQPNTLKLTGYIFNALKGFANYLRSQVYDPSEALTLGNYEVTADGYFVPVPYTVYTVGAYPVWNVTREIKINTNNPDVRLIFVKDGDSNYFLYGVSENNFEFQNKSSSTNTWSTASVTRSWYSDVNKYLYTGRVQYTNNPDARFILGDDITVVDALPSGFVNTAVYYTFGIGASSGDTTLNDVFALPQQGVLDDEIGATDPEDDVQLDLTDSDLNLSIIQSLADIIGQVKALTDSYVLDDSWPETIGKVIAQPIVIPEDWPDVAYPEAPDWPVPHPIATPEILPLIIPDCPDLSACLVAGIRDVGTSIGNVIESNSNVSNYVSVILFMGIALSILGGI